MIKVGNEAVGSYQISGSPTDQTSKNILLNEADRKTVGVWQNSPIHTPRSAVLQNLQNQLQARPPKLKPREYRASSNQKQLWMHNQFNPESTTYNLHQVMHFKNGVDINIFRLSFEEIIKRHDVMRTTFREEDGVLYASVHNEIMLEWGIIDAKEMSVEQIKEQGMQRSMKLYDLQKGPLNRLYFFVRSDDVVVLIARHHIVFDAWSNGVLISELGAIYTALKNNQPIPLPPLKSQYHELSKWQTPFTDSHKGIEQLNYWKKLLENIPPIEMPMARKKPHVREFTGENVNFQIEDDLCKAIDAQAKRQKVSAHVFTLSAYLITLYHYTNADDMAVRVPTPGRLRAVNDRERADFSENIGYFVNPTVFRTPINSKQKIEDFIAQINTRTIDNRNNQDFPLLTLLEKFNFKIPEIGFNFVKPRPGEKFNPFTYDGITPVILGDLNYTLLHMPQQKDLLDLNFLIFANNISMKGFFYFRSDVMSIKDAERFTNHFKQVMRQMVDNPQLTVGEVCLLTGTEKQQLLIEHNYTVQIYPAHQTLFNKFAEQVKKTPDQIAIAFGQKQLTYREMSIRVHQLANRLRAEGASNKQIIAILTEPCAETVIGIMAILASGAAYLPIDPQTPSERIAYMLEDSSVNIILTQQKFNPAVTPFVKKVIHLEDPSLQHENISTFSPPATSPQDLAYIIYTSGSTGQPKGAMITHQNAMNYLTWASNYYSLDQGSGSPLHSSIAFDLTITSIFPALLSGKTVFVTQAGPEGLMDALQKRQDFSLIKLTPAHLRILETGLSKDVIKQLSCVFVVGGEALTAEDIQFLRGNPRIRIVNEYGPTETTVGCCIEEVTARTTHSGALPIGLPIANTQLYVLNEAMQPCPIGVPGELYIGGDSVGPGYNNREELTRNRFVANPFSEDTQSRLYKTGDVVKWSDQGYLEYIGRNDFQAKIKGYRIELGDIENAILRFERVQECVVIVREDAPPQKQLVAYVVLRTQPGDQPAEAIDLLKQQIKAQLPEYMVPAHFVVLPKMPLTINGKIERKALPKPERGQTDHTKYVAPRNDFEQKMADIWQSLLNYKPIGIHDNFFELGGDSILGISMIARAKKIGLKITTQQLKTSPTIAQLVEMGKIEEVQNSRSQLAVFDINAPIPQTPIQQWFLERTLPWTHSIMSSPLLAVNGTLNISVLDKALQIIAERHDALRIRYKKEKEGYVQYLTDDNIVKCSEHDFSKLPKEAQEAAITQTSFDLRSSIDIESGPIFKAALFHTQEGQRLFLFAHHLVIDGVSWRVLLEEIQQVYLQLLEGKNISLPERSTSFQEWAHALSNYAQSDALQSEVKYWQAVTQDKIATLPKDEVTNEKKSKVEQFVVKLNPKLTDKLLKEAPQAYQTQINDILLTALTLAFSKFTGEPSLYLNLEGHGREDLINGADLSLTVGWFTSLFPVRLKLKDPSDLEGSLIATKAQLAQIPNKGMSYGILRYLSTSEEAKSLRNQPRPEVCFNYFGQMDDRISNQSGLFSFAKERIKPFIKEDNPPAELLDIQCMIIHGSLSVNFFYDSSAYKETTVARLGHEFMSSLEKIIEMCCKKDSNIPGAKL